MAWVQAQVACLLRETTELSVTRRSGWAICLVVCAALFCAQAFSAPTWEQVQAFYAYDASAPLDAEAEEPVDSGILSVQTVRFRSVNDEMVPATVSRPKTEGKVPVILFLHGLGGSRADSAKVAPLLAGQGVAIVSIDAAHHGDRRAEGGAMFSADLEMMVKGFRQTIIDNRRALDYIASRDDLDAERVVLVGVSMGGILGSMVASLDERILAPFLIVGGGDLVGILQTSEIGVAQEIRQQLQSSEAVREQAAFIEPTNFIANLSPRPLLMLNGRDDKIVPAAAGEALFAAAQEPKRIVWYEGGAMEGHMPPFDVLIPMLAGFLKDQGLIACP